MHYKKQKTFTGEMIYGRRTVEEFLKTKPDAKQVQEIFINPSLPAILQQKITTALPKVPLRIVPRRELEQLFPGIHHQGIVIKAHIGCKFVNKHDSWQQHIEQERGLIVLLDAIQDPVNLGNIVRSAEVLGVKALFLTGKGAPLSDVVHRVSSGASLHLAIFSFANLSQLIQILKKLNFWICAGAGEEAIQGPRPSNGTRQKSIRLNHQNLHSLPKSDDLALIIGHEGDGVKPLAIQQSDFIISIPQKGRVSSLNAATAAAILMDRLIFRD